MDGTRKQLEEEYKLASASLSRAAASFAVCRKKTERRVKHSKHSTIKYIHDVQGDSFGRLFGHLKGAPEQRKVVGVHKLLLSRFESTSPVIPPLSGVSDHCEVRTKDRNLENIIHWCCRAGEAERLVRKIESGGDIQGRNNKGETPLHICAFYNQAKCCEILLDNGVSIDCVDDDGWAPIHWAVHQSNLEITKILIKRKADINLKLPKGGTPLDLASKGDEDGAKMLQLLQQLESVGKFRKVDIHASKWSGVLDLLEANAEAEEREIAEQERANTSQAGPDAVHQDKTRPSMLVRRASQTMLTDARKSKIKSLHMAGAHADTDPHHMSFAGARLEHEASPAPGSPLAPDRRVMSPYGRTFFRTSSGSRARAAQRLEDMRKHMFKQASIADSAIPHRVYSETKVKPLMQGYGPIVYLLKSCLAVTIEEINQQTTAKILANNFGLGKKAGRRASLLGRVPS